MECCEYGPVIHLALKYALTLVKSLFCSMTKLDNFVQGLYEMPRSRTIKKPHFWLRFHFVTFLNKIYCTATILQLLNSTRMIVKIKKCA